MGKEGTISLIHGFICSGKTTFAKKLEAEELNTVRFTLDEWMCKLYGTNPPAELFNEYHKHVENLIWENCSKLIKSGSNVILDFGFWTKASREKIIKKATALGAKIKLYNVSCPEKEMLKRLESRPHDKQKGIFHITPETFETLKKKYEPIQGVENKKRIDVKA